MPNTNLNSVTMKINSLITEIESIELSKNFNEEELKFIYALKNLKSKIDSKSILPSILNSLKAKLMSLKNNEIQRGNLKALIDYFNRTNYNVPKEIKSKYAETVEYSTVKFAEIK